MANNFDEKRNSPRVNADLELQLPKGITAESIDFSEGGLKLNSKETISSPMVSVSIKFPDKKGEFKAKAQLVWQRDTGLGDSIYGIKFVNLKDSQKKALREELIENQLKDLINEIKDEEAKGYILKFFSSDILDYINEITEVTERHGEEAEYSQELEKKLEHLNNKILLKGYCLELLLTDKAILQKVKENFRDLVGVWVYKSAIVKRAFEKPIGYPEDYRMLELIYENSPVSKNIGLYFDNIFLKSPYSVSIRNRKNHLARKIIGFINNSQLNSLNILSVCSGTGHEIADALPLLKPHKKVKFTFVETDEKALDFSRNLLSQKMEENIRFDFKHEAVFRILEADRLINKYDKQNLIYTLGIIDYLSDRAAKRIIKVLYSSLEKGGKLILTHRDRDKTFPPIPPDWLCDWKVIARNQEEMSKLFYEVGISNFSLSTESDNFGYIHYFTLTKNE
mgnify:CR=1 FL=1